MESPKRTQTSRVPVNKDCYALQVNYWDTLPKVTSVDVTDMITKAMERGEAEKTTVFCFKDFVVSRLHFISTTFNYVCVTSHNIPTLVIDIICVMQF